MEHMWTSAGMPLLLQIIDQSPAAIVLTDPAGDIQAANPAFATLTGYEPSSCLGKNIRILKSGRHKPQHYRQFWKALTTTGSWQGQFWNRKRRGAVVPQWVQVSALRDGAGQTTHYLCILSDIRKLKLADERTLHLAYHDALTGLPNRLLFY